MKTPMQELIEQLEYSIGLAEGTLYEYGLKSAKSKAEAMLKKEKETIVNFTYKCRNVMAADEFAITHWYEKTFNTKEK